MGKCTPPKEGRVSEYLTSLFISKEKFDSHTSRLYPRMLNQKVVLGNFLLLSLQLYSL
jgi:hypothetical protein